MIEQLIAHVLWQAHMGDLVAWGSSLVLVAVVTRWIVRRRQSTALVRELKAELRMQRAQATRELARLERQRDRYMDLALVKAARKVQDEGEAAAQGR